MKAAAFSYARATSIADALQLPAYPGDDAKVLSGGQSLMPAPDLLSRPAILVDSGRLSELRGMKVASDKATIGALARHVDLLGSREAAERLLPLREAPAHVARPGAAMRRPPAGFLTCVATVRGPDLAPEQAL